MITRASHAGLLLLNVVVGVFVTSIAQASGFRASGWENGADGFESALREAERDELPMIVYFNTEWCKWCRKLNESYLPNRQVQSVLEYFVKVSVNPEDGADELRLFERFGGGGYPSFFVFLPVANGQPSKLSPFRKDGSLSPENFAQEISERAANAYERSGIDLARQGDCKAAIEDFETALQWTESRQADLHFNIGRCYHLQAREQRDEKLLEQARAHYEDALLVDPNHAASRKALDSLD
jgi:tetratricopeptide (TPR) repeat protein